MRKRPNLMKSLIKLRPKKSFPFWNDVLHLLTNRRVAPLLLTVHWMWAKRPFACHEECKATKRLLDRAYHSLPFLMLLLRLLVKRLGMLQESSQLIVETYVSIYCSGHCGPQCRRRNPTCYVKMQRKGATLSSKHTTKPNWYKNKNMVL